MNLNLFFMHFSNTNLFVLLIFLLSSCSSITKNTDSIADTDINRINEIYRIQSLVAKDVWPGFEQAEFRFVMVGEKHQWAINVNPLPDYYKSIPVSEKFNKKIESVAVTDIYRNEAGEKFASAPDIIYNASSKENTELHFKHSIYLVKTLEDFLRVGDKQDAETWVHISLHELFHTYQDKYVNYSPEFLKSTSVSIKKILPDDREHNRFLQSEVKLLGQAACSSLKDETKKLLKQALVKRDERWRYIHKKFNVSPEHWERFESWAEGTAHYTEHQIMVRYREYQDETLLKSDPFFNHFEEYKVENQKTWCERIAKHQKKKYWYTLGFAYALILDKLLPEWKEGKFDNQLFFDAFFVKLGIYRPER